MKGVFKKLLKFGFAGALSLLAIVPSAAHAAESSIDVEIPVTTEFAADSDIPAKTVKLNTNFELVPLDEAPAPEVAKLYIPGAGKGQLGPITFTVPGNYYYQLTAKLEKGENNDPIDETLIVRVTVVNDANGGLSSVVTAYHSQADASVDNGKVDTKFQIKYKKPPEKKAETTKTSVYNQPGLWILIGGCALFILIGAARRSKAR